jgi:uncharacterized membrane protein
MICLGLLVFMGCFAQRNEVVQKDSVSAIQFTGSTENATFAVYSNGNVVYGLTKVDKGLRYTLRPGVYRIEVTKGGYNVVKRQLFVGDGETQEIRIP